MLDVDELITYIVVNEKQITDALIEISDTYEGSFILNLVKNIVEEIDK